MQKLFKPILILYAIYLGLALLIITPALNILPARYVQDNYQRDLQTRFVWLNPFTLSLEVRGLELPETNGEQFLALASASVNLSLNSVFREGVVLDALRVSELDIHAARITQDSFNFSDFMPSDDGAPEPQETESDPIPAITISEVDLHSKTIKLSDLSRAQPWSSHWHDLHIQVQDLSTVLVEGKPYTIKLSSGAGGSLSWEGLVSIPNSESEGKLQISGLNLHNFWQFAEPWVQFELVDGSLDLGARYRINWEDSFSYYIDEGSVALKALDVSPKDGVDLPDTRITLESLSIQGIGVNSAELAVDMQSLDINGLDVAGYSEGDLISLQQLFSPVVSETTAEPANETPADNSEIAASDSDQYSEQHSDQNWQAKLATATMRGSGLAWRSEYTEPELLTVSPIDVKLTALAWPLDGTSTASLSISVNELATLAMDGELGLASGDGNFNYKLAQLHLPWFNPNLPDGMKVELASGELQLQGSASLSAFTPAQISLDGAVSDFSIKQEDAVKTFGRWKTVSVDDLALDFDARHLALQELTIDSLNGRLHIESDGTINTSHLMEEQPADTGQPQDEEQVEQTEAAPQTPAEQAWSADIASIVVHESRVDFADESLSKAFRTDLVDLNGEITGLSSSATEPARVHLTGSVEGYAPVELSGTMQPLHVPPMLDLSLSFDGLDMARFTPYSGTYTGYAIERGLLHIDLDYQVQENRLKGANGIVLSKLKFGDKVQSDKALDLPLELALSLLTDSKGVITLDVPVAGNLDDPQFRLGSVIIKAFTQVLVSAVTKPFSVLAGLVGSDDDFQHIVFASGSAQLDDKNREKLTELASALAQRPKLSLALAGQLHPEADRLRLQRNVLDQQLRDAGLQAADLEGKTPAWAEAVSRRFRRLDGAAEDPVPTPREQYRLIAATIEIPDENLDTLVTNRAEAVQAFLVNETGMAPERVSIDPDRINSDTPPISGVQLYLDS